MKSIVNSHYTFYWNMFPFVLHSFVPEEISKIYVKNGNVRQNLK